MSKVLVTGAGGFIGFHLVERLDAEGRHVRAFIEYDSRGSWGWLDDVGADTRGAIEVITGDIRDSHAVRQATTGCDTVFHLAALIGIPCSYLAPESYVGTNVTETLNIVQAASDLGGKRVVHTSTSEVYGTAQYVTIDEAHPLNPQYPYAATKVGARGHSHHHHPARRPLPGGRPGGDPPRRDCSDARFHLCWRHGAPTKSSTVYSDRADVVASQLELPAAIPFGELDTAPHPLDIGENAAVREQ